MVHKEDKSCTVHKVVSTIGSINSTIELKKKKKGLDLLIHW
jgi:hypothetical protein